MNHPIYPVHAVEIAGPYTVRVQFTDDTEQIIYLNPMLAGELYRPLLDLQLFNQVIGDREIKALVWPNGADFDPATLHDWPKHKEAFAPTPENGRGYRPDELLNSLHSLVSNQASHYNGH